METEEYETKKLMIGDDWWMEERWKKDGGGRETKRRRGKRRKTKINRQGKCCGAVNADRERVKEVK